jgi:hypothetical protein
LRIAATFEPPNGNFGPVLSQTNCYNFCRLHETIRVTPAMEAGLTNHVWEIEEVVALID